MKELEAFTGQHKRVLVMMGASSCIACDVAGPHLAAAAEQYQKKLWIAYVDITEAGIKVSSIPLFQGFFNGFKLPELMEHGYSLEGLNDLMDRLWNTKMNKPAAEKN